MHDRGLVHGAVSAQAAVLAPNVPVVAKLAFFGLVGETAAIPGSVLAHDMVPTRYAL